MLKRVALFLSFICLTPSLGFSAEAGYKEAMEYFLVRDKLKKSAGSKKASAVKGQSSQGSIIINPKKYYLGLGAGEVFSADHYTVELGLSFIQHKYFQQSLGLEYVYFNTRDFDEYKTGAIENSHGQGLFLLHSVQLSSQFFYFGPELSAGVGRFFDSPRKGGLLMLKAGLVFSNEWSKSFLFSAHLYYRRSQYFKKDYHDDGLGLSLRFGF